MRLDRVLAKQASLSAPITIYFFSSFISSFTSRASYHSTPVPVSVLELASRLSGAYYIHDNSLGLLKIALYKLLLCLYISSRPFSVPPFIWGHLLPQHNRHHGFRSGSSLRGFPYRPCPSILLAISRYLLFISTATTATTATTAATAAARRRRIACLWNFRTNPIRPRSIFQSVSF